MSWEKKNERIFVMFKMWLCLCYAVYGAKNNSDLWNLLKSKIETHQTVKTDRKHSKRSRYLNDSLRHFYVISPNKREKSISNEVSGCLMLGQEQTVNIKPTKSKRKKIQFTQKLKREREGKGIERRWKIIIIEKRELLLVANKVETTVHRYTQCFFLTMFVSFMHTTKYAVNYLVWNEWMKYGRWQKKNR